MNFGKGIAYAVPLLTFAVFIGSHHLCTGFQPIFYK